MANNNRVKVSGYAQRVFFNDNIEYRDFSENLVGNQFTSEGGVTLFTMGNFTVTTNLDPKPDRVFKTGTFSDYFCLDDISSDDTTYLTIEGNLKTQLNLDITNPLHYVWYGNFKEFARVSLGDISNKWPGAIYVDNKVGSISGDNITNYSYDPISDTSTITIPTKYFINPFSIKYTKDASLVNDSEELSTLRNMTVNYLSYIIDVNGVEFKLKEFTGSTTTTNDIINVVVDKEVFPTLTGNSGSIPYFIKPNEQEREGFFSGLNEFQRNILNRLTNPIYTIELSYPQEGSGGIIVYTNTKLTFPLMDDGYNLNFFDGIYNSYAEQLVNITEGYDDTQTNLMVRKYTAEIINSFDTAPRCDGDDLINDGAKATSLLNIYGREFDEVKKYINGIKYAHVVTYDKKDNVPDTLVKDLAWMLGFDGVDFLSDIDLNKSLLPSNGKGEFSGTSRNLTLQELDIELYRRIILNIAWLWKSKGARKAIEFLFRFIGAPESIVVFDEHVYVADKPLDVEQVKRMLYLYTGDVDITNLPFDENGYPLPPQNGDQRILSFIDASGNTIFSDPQEIYFQKGGGWYRETGGVNSSLDLNSGNNPHVGPYDAGREYINYFTSDCFIPGYSPTNTVFSAHTILYENLFINYNYGFINGIPTTFDLYASPLTTTNQLLSECINLTATIDNSCPPLSGGTVENAPSTILEELCINAKKEYDEWVLKIQEEPYLQYSPEWEIIKRNNEIASINYFGSVNAGSVCNDNSCIELCVGVNNKTDTNPCDEWVLVDDADSAPFIYFTDSDDNKVLFDDFPVCCVANGGVYKDFTFQNGKEACYCARSAPCNGLVPSATGTDGIVVWEQTDGNTNVPSVNIAESNSENIYFSISEVSLNCYYQITPIGESNGLTPEILFQTDSGSLSGYLNLGYVTETCFKGSIEGLTILDENGWNVLQSPPVVTNVSAECCVWYGYLFSINEDGNVVCNDNSLQQGNNSTETNTAVSLESLDVINKEYETSLAKFGPDSKTTIEIKSVLDARQSLYQSYESDISNQQKQTTYNTEKIVSEYEIGGNLNMGTSIYNTLGGQYNRLNNGVYLKFTTIDITSANFDSAFDNPELNDCTVWQPKVDQLTGFVSFEVTDVDGEVFNLPEDREIYKNCCSAKGYTFGCFKQSGVDGSLIPVVCDEGSVGPGSENIPSNIRDINRSNGDTQFATNGVSPNSSVNTIKKCVDPDFITCTDVSDVKMVFAANEWNGFYLPKEVDGKCEIDIQADIMIKYDAESLLGCASNNTCGFHYPQYDNSLYDVNCMNWVTFTEYDNVLDDLRNNKQIVDLNSVIEWSEVNPNYVDLGDINTSQYIPYFDDINIDVWQTPGLQSEPNSGCCQALGGELVSTSEWGNIHTTNVNEINTQFNGLIENNGTTENNYDSYISDLLTLTNTYGSVVSGITCIDLTTFKYDGEKCIDFTQLITTENVCYLTIPAECGIYSKIIEGYWVMINQLQLAKEEIEDCIDQRETLESNLTELIAEKRELLVTLSTLKKECKRTIEGYENNLSECNKTIESINNTIKSYSTLILDLQNSISVSQNYIDNPPKSGHDPAQLAANQQNIINSNSQIQVITSQINQQLILLGEQQTICDEISTQLENTKEECAITTFEIKESIKLININIRNLTTEITSLSCCNVRVLDDLENLLMLAGSGREIALIDAKNCYDNLNTEREQNYQQYLADQIEQVLNYVDDLEVCLTLEVDNNIGTTTVDLNQRYTTIDSLTTTVWEFDPYEDYTGIIFDGDTTKVNAIEQAMFVKMRERYGDESVTQNTFVANWKHTSLPITDVQLMQLKTLYPDRPFFIGVAIKNFECDVCVLIDNIQINIETDEIERKFSMESCPSFDLSCVIDDKKSWVFSDGGVTEVVDVPGINSCNLPAQLDNTTKIIKFEKPQERLWLDLEYRNADYEVNHEHLVLNSKSATFRIDAAKAIECDVYNFWQQIDCSSSACTGTTSAVTKSDCLITGYTTVCVCEVFSGGSECITCSDGYTLEGDNVTCTKIEEELAIANGTIYNVSGSQRKVVYGNSGGRFYSNVDSNKLPITLDSNNKFNDNTPTEITPLNIIENTLWGQNDNTLNGRLNDVGVWASGSTGSTYFPVNEWIGFSFCVDTISGGSYTIGMAADNRIRLKVNGSTYMEMNQGSPFNFNYWHIFNIELSGGRNIFEMEARNDGTDARFGAEIYDADISTLTGITTESALSAVTIFSTETIKNNGGVFDLGENSGFSCPSGFALQTCGDEFTCVSISKEAAIISCTGCSTEQKYIEVNPLDFLDFKPSEINVKENMDAMVVSNLIDVKSRQVLGGYPLLAGFYELYLQASNCGKELSGHLDYNNLFEFTDLIGDYWLDLLEQVIPATTIMDGCDNSGKVYRNHIFDQPKHSYKRYALNYFYENTDGLINGTECTLEGVTTESIGEERLSIELTETVIIGGEDTIPSDISSFTDVLLSEVYDGPSIKAQRVINSYDPITQFNKVFITQIYDTNEYEGDVTIVGDPEWDKYDELIYDCS
jgi:hypothetical protein